MCCVLLRVAWCLFVGVGVVVVGVVVVVVGGGGVCRVLLRLVGARCGVLLFVVGCGCPLLCVARCLFGLCVVFVWCCLFWRSHCLLCVWLGVCCVFVGR